MVNSIKQWFGRLGNNICQICNGIIYSQFHNHGFISPFHQYINVIDYNTNGQPPTNYNNFFFWFQSVDGTKDFEIAPEVIINNTRDVAKTWVAPNFKFPVEEPLDDDTLVIHIRNGDLFQGKSWMLPPPLAYYLEIIQKYKKTLVVAEQGNNPVVPALQRLGIKIQSSTVEEDFSTLLRAKNLAISCGTFAVTAALCSTNIKNVYCFNYPYVKEKDITTHVINGENYLTSWENTPEQLKFILEYNLQ